MLDPHRDPDQIRRNAAALEIALTSGEMDELNRISDGIKRKMGANLDPWRNAGGPAQPRID